VLALHDRLLALDGGAAGVRDLALLSSALARPQQHHAYGKSPGIVELAAIYTVGVIRNHPFADGNKRTAFVVGVLFLEMNGFRFTASEEEAANTIWALAARKLSEPAFVDWLRKNVEPE